MSKVKILLGLARLIERSSVAGKKGFSRVLASLKRSGATSRKYISKALTKVPKPVLDKITSFKKFFTSGRSVAGKVPGTVLARREPTWLVKATTSLSAKYPAMGAVIAKSGGFIRTNKFAKFTLGFIRDLAVFMGVDYVIDLLTKDGEVTKDEAAEMVSIATGTFTKRKAWMAGIDNVEPDAASSQQIRIATDAIGAYIFSRKAQSLTHLSENYSALGKAVLVSRLISLAKDIFNDTQFETSNRLFIIQAAMAEENDVFLSESYESYLQEDHDNPTSAQSMDDMLLQLMIGYEGSREVAFRRFVDACDVWPDKAKNIDFADEEVVNSLTDIYALSLVADEPCGMDSDYVDEDEDDEVMAHNIVEAAAVAADVVDTQGRFARTGDIHYFNSIYR